VSPNSLPRKELGLPNYLHLLMLYIIVTLHPKPKIQVVCVKWGTLYSADYVNKLHNGLRRNTLQNFKFTCFTENQKGIDHEINCRTLPHRELRGWWNKVFLFSSEVGIKDRILYFDLDTVIVGNLDEIMNFNGTFAALRRLGKQRGFGSFGSGVMSWQGGWGHNIWEKFKEKMSENQTKKGGDQAFLSKVIRPEHVTLWQEWLKDSKIIGYKKDCRSNNNKIPTGTNVVCFHGNPRPHEIQNLSWMKAHWK
jgi:hypothetical protein